MDASMSQIAPSHFMADGDLQEKIARTISDACEAWLKGGLGMSMPQFVAARLMPVVTHAHADLLHEIADDIHFNVKAPEGSSDDYANGMDDGANQLFEQLRERAGRISRAAHG